MRNVNRIAGLLIVSVLALAGCRKESANQNAGEPVAMNNDVAANADIEALPADESSATPSDQLEAGDDNADVNELGNGDNSQ
jgi:hypothetical protein